MDYNKRPYFYGTGRRKKSVARVRLYNGTGKVTINGRDIDDYFGLDTLKPLAAIIIKCKTIDLICVIQTRILEPVCRFLDLL